MNLTIGKKIALSFGAILALVLLSSSINLFNSSTVDEDVKMIDKRFYQLSLFSEFKYQFKNTTLAYMEAIIDAESNQVDSDVFEIHKEFGTFIEKNRQNLLDAVDTPEETENLESILNNVTLFRENGDSLLKSIAAGEPPEIFEKYDNVIDEVANKTAELIAKNVESIQEEYHEAYDNLTLSNDRNILFQWLLSSITVISGLFLAFFITRMIVSILNNVSNNLAQAADKTLASAGQLSTSSTELSSSSTEQASSIEETTSSLEEMGRMVENNVENAGKAVELSNGVITKSKEANSSMEKLEVSMKDILESNDKIEELVKVIANIGEKTKIMDEIVFQTKLLSFNASVEAERAGEHGRGFAVVAQEVGNLAQMSGKAAQEIAVIVKDSIKNAQVITTENKSKVEQGNKYVIESAKVLKEIVDSAQVVSEGSTQVLNASKDQDSGIKQINAAMVTLDKSIQQNASTAEETASSSQELNAQASYLKQIVSDLSYMVLGYSRDDNSAKERPSTPSSRVQNVYDLNSYREQNKAPIRSQNVANSDITYDYDDDEQEADDDNWDKL
jgi:methyl-accepting chemotaxis protein